MDTFAVLSYREVSASASQNAEFATDYIPMEPFSLCSFDIYVSGQAALNATATMQVCNGDPTVAANWVNICCVRFTTATVALGADGTYIIQASGVATRFARVNVTFAAGAATIAISAFAKRL